MRCSHGFGDTFRPSPVLELVRVDRENQKSRSRLLDAPTCWGVQLNKKVRGRIELVIGRLGAGKTTFGAERANEIARKTDRPLATTGKDWGEKWFCVNSFEVLENLRDHVLLWDEIHLWAPSMRGAVSGDYERQLLKILSLGRKRGLCVVGTTQARTRVATHVRQLVTQEWHPKALIPGVVHRAKSYESHEDGGKSLGSARWYSPKYSEVPIPTGAEVWLPPSLWGEETEVAPQSQQQVVDLASLGIKQKRAGRAG